MKLTVATVMLPVLLTMLNVRSVLGQATPTPASDNKPPASNIVQTIHSTIMDEDRRVIIHLPRNYSKETALVMALNLSLCRGTTDRPAGGIPA